MAVTINIVCPKCGNKSRVPGEVEGRNIRCKDCNTVFIVKREVVKAASPKAGPAKSGVASGVAVKADDHESGIAKTPYAVTHENLAARCPFCAMSLDPPDARICLHCGYDMQKRRRVDSKKTYEITAADYLVYHLATIFCVIGICILLGIDLLALIFREDIMKDSWFDNSDGTYVVKPGIVPLYIFLFSLAGIVPMARVIIKRLINFSPPEITKKDKGEYDS